MKDLSILSTKKLTSPQRELLLNSGLRFVEYNAITTSFIEVEVPKSIKNAIFTSQNGVASISDRDVSIENCFCVGEKTTALLLKNGQNVSKTCKNGAELGEFLIKEYKNESFYYFCGNNRRDELPSLLKKEKMSLFELKTYKTELNLKKFDQNWHGILFFSPSGVESFTKGQKDPNTDDFLLPKNTQLFCIGETTAQEARKYSSRVIIANSTRIESVIAKAVKTLKNN